MSENPNAPQHINLEVVYSPAGEMFEMSPANARDVKSHAGWTNNKPHPDDVAAYLASQGLEAPAPVAEDNTDETSSDDNSDENVNANADDNSDDNSDENANADDNSDDTSGNNDAEDKVKTLAIHFADMDKDAVRVYIEEVFPGTEIDGRWNRDKLVALSLELAANRA